MAATTTRANAPQHSLDQYDVVVLLGSDPKRGLTEAQAAQRLERFGPNVLPATAGVSALRRLLRQLQHPLIYVLLAAGAVTLALGEYVDSAVIFGVVVVNAVVGYIQESHAEAALDALRAMVRTRASVVRDGRARIIASDGLVPGDLVRLEAGDKVPADLRVLRHAELNVDESALTGESLPVAKDEAALPLGTAVADRRNMLHSSTLVTHGRASAIVVATGADTEIGRIHRLVGTADVLATPLTRKLSWFSKVLTAVILGLAVVTFAIGVLRGEPVAGMVTAAVALAVGAIPEGLPAAVTITLAIGVSRMARRRAVIRRLPAVETLGSTTVICTDKTGTLTSNQMTVRSLWTPADRLAVTGVGYSPDGLLTDESGQVALPGPDSAAHLSLLAAALCNDARLGEGPTGWEVVGDPTEGALLVAAGKAGFDLDGIREDLPRTSTVPFTSERRFMATLHQGGTTGSPMVLVKGAVERVLLMCADQLGAGGRAAPLDHDAVTAEAERLASDGFRVLATAVCSGPDCRLDEESLTGTLTLTGLLAMHDPPRPDARAAVENCHAAGIEVKMITGDHAGTARAIAARVGILPEHDTGAVLTGRDLDVLSDDEYADAVDQVSVFARVSPEQKLRLVRALQTRGHVVAMTGDGVNDAPALRQADIGIAMGRGGTEVAKEAADMVLTDDDFATIEEAVEEGRGVFDNLTKFIVWTLPTNMAEGLVILVAIVLGQVLPILPVQILWINMTTAVALGLMLAFEPREPGIMTRPPRDPSRPLLTGALVSRILLVSALLVGGAWWAFEWERAAGASLAESRTVALNLFVTVEVFYLFACRSLTQPVRRIGYLSNHWVLGGVAVQVVGQVALTYLPVMNRLFHTAPVSAESWLRILVVAVLASVVVGVDKRLRHQPM